MKIIAFEISILGRALQTLKRLSSTQETKSCTVLTKTGGVQFLWVPSRGVSCSIVKLNFFSSAFVDETSSNVSEKIVVKSHSHQKLTPKTREVLIMKRNKLQDHPFQRTEPTEY